MTSSQPGCSIHCTSIQADNLHRYTTRNCSQPYSFFHVVLISSVLVFFKTVIIKYVHDTVILNLISDQQASENYFSEVQSISQLLLILNATKTHEMLFTSQRQPPVITPMTIDNKAIAILVRSNTSVF